MLKLLDVEIQELLVAEQQIVAEEEGHLQSFLHGWVGRQNQPKPQLQQQIVELYQHLNRAVAEDEKAQFHEQLERLTQIAHSTGVDIPLNLCSPYFAHFGIQLEGQPKRQFLIGEQTYKHPQTGLQILDWQNSPLAALFFRYDLEEEFEEQIGSQLCTGMLLFKRGLDIKNGQLCKIYTKNSLWFKAMSSSKNSWQKTTLPKLKGGGGRALRPKGALSSVQHPLFAERWQTLKQNLDLQQTKYLHSNAELLAFRGQAGAGKTTTALCRLVALAQKHTPTFHNPTFQSKKGLICVDNQALVVYLNKFLASFGLQLPICTYQQLWADWFFKYLPFKKHKDSTEAQPPLETIKLKRHSAMLEFLDYKIHELQNDFAQKLADILQQQPAPFPIQTFSQYPFITAVHRLKTWLHNAENQNKTALKADSEPGSIILTVRLQRLVDETVEDDKDSNQHFKTFFKYLWADAKQYFKTHPPVGFSNTQLETALFGLLTTNEIHSEDYPILIYLYTQLVRPVHEFKPSLKFDYFLLDEVQNLSGLELRLLASTATPPKCFTLAGDFNQQLQMGVEDWAELCQNLDVREPVLVELKVNHRSDPQITNLALELLNSKVTASPAKKLDKVRLFQFEQRGHLIWFLAEQLKELCIHERNANVVVIAPTANLAQQYFEQFKAAEVPNLRLIQEQDFNFTAGVDLTDCQQIQGLEFDYVILLDVDPQHFPNQTYHRKLLYTLVSRAMHQLWIFNQPPSSYLLPEWLRLTVEQPCTN